MIVARFRVQMDPNRVNLTPKTGKSNDAEKMVGFIKNYLRAKVANNSLIYPFSNMTGDN